MKTPVLIDRALLAVAAVSGLMAVAAGAYGAHGSGDQGAVRALDLIETAGRYQMWHALAIVGCYALKLTTRLPTLAFVGGILLFCGSLYALAFGAPRVLTYVTPFGGGLFLLGWAALAFTVVRGPRPR